MANRYSDPDAIDLLLDGGVVAFQRGLARAVGDATAGLLLSQLWYWSKTPQARERDGWFYKTQEELYEETVLSRREQETARRRLRELGVLEERKVGVPAKLWFRINRSAVKRLLEAHALQHGGKRHSRMAESANQGCAEQPFQDGGKRHPRMAESANQGCTEQPHQDGGIRHPNTKITSEITSENTAADDGTPAAAGYSQLVESLLAHGLNARDAERLARVMPDECCRQLAYLAYYPTRSNPGGWLRDAIENRFGAPSGYAEAREREERARRKADEMAQASARQSHEKAHRAAYLAYLEAREGELRNVAPEAFSGFLQRDAEERAGYERAAMPPSVLTRVLEDHDRRTAYLSRFRDHFSQVQNCDTLVLDFWAWDRQLNPTPFQPRGE